MARKRIALLMTAILVLAGSLRLAAVPYGLPLWLIADEPQFVLIAAVMAQFPTLAISSVPQYASILYNPPYLVYLLLLPFLLLVNVVDMVDVASAAFMVGRLLSVAFGVLTVWMVGRTAARIFPDHTPSVPLLAAYLLATSMLGTAVFATVRHWSLATFLVAWGVFALVNRERSPGTRLGIICILAGIAMGVNQAASLLLVFFAALWLFYVERHNLRTIISARRLYLFACIGLFLAVLPFLLYPGSLRGVRQEKWPIVNERTLPLIGDFLTAPFRFFGSLAESEPVLVALTVVGLAFLWAQRRRLFWVFCSTILLYVAMFHFLYFLEHRFLVLLLPVIVILGARGAQALRRALPRPWGGVLVGVLLAMPLIVSTRFSYLLSKNDSRQRARAWFEDNVPARSRVMTRVSLMRLSATPQSITEKSRILGTFEFSDPNERNEYLFPDRQWGRVPFHALDLTQIRKSAFYADLVGYACDRGYQYVIADAEGLGGTEGEQVSRLIEGATTLASFGVGEEAYSVTATRFRAPPWRLFALPLFGPRVGIYELAREKLCGKDVALPPPPSLLRTVLDVADTVPKGELYGFPFTLDAPTILHFILTPGSDYTGVSMFIFTKEEFEGFSRKEKPISGIRFSDAAGTATLSGGSYVFVLVSPERDFTYALTLVAE